MKAILLAGGRGTRLYPLTFSIPKGLLPVGEKAILEIIIEKLRQRGIKDIYLAAGYKSELIKSYFNNGSRHGVRIKYFTEDKPLGTAGPIRKIVKKFNIKEHFIVMNGDLLTNVDFKKMKRFHMLHKAILTVGIKDVIQQVPYGVVSLEGEEVINLTEKPRKKYSISTGIYLLDPRAVEYIPKERYYDITDLINKLVSLKKRVRGYTIKEYWLALDKAYHFEKAFKEIKKWGNR